jgi:hypothetical protein
MIFGKNIIANKMLVLIFAKTFSLGNFSILE